MYKIFETFHSVQISSFDREKTIFLVWQHFDIIFLAKRNICNCISFKIVGYRWILQLVQITYGDYRSHIESKNNDIKSCMQPEKLWVNRKSVAGIFVLEREIYFMKIKIQKGK